MKVCFAAPLDGFSGYSVTSRNLLRALSHGGMDIAARTLRYDQRDPGQQFDTPIWLKELLRKPITNIDLLIQSTTLNIEAQPKPGICNAIMFYAETDRIPPAWAEKANMFDLIMVPTRFVAMALINSGVTKPILLGMPPLDTDIYKGIYGPLDIPNTEGRTVFYNICQLSAKKGVDALIRAYYAAFADIPNEVLLVLKTYIGMTHRNNERAEVKGFIDKIKQGCRIPIKQYPPILPIVNIMTDDVIYGLHMRGDAYVNSSRGEGLCVPAMDSVGFGTSLITNNCSGMADWVNSNFAMIYGAQPTHVYDMRHGDPSLYTGVERYYEPSTAEMADIMRQFHEWHQNPDKYPEQTQGLQAMRDTGREFIKQLDYRVVAKKIVDQLAEAHESWKKTGKVEFQNEQMS